MKNFEERYTAWLDGTLDERERAEFEATLPDREEALRDGADWQKLRGLMRETLVPAAMPHADFVNSQVLAAIHRETPAPRPPVKSWFPVGRLAWSGAFLLALAAVLSAVILPHISRAPGEDQYISQVIAARASDPKLGAYAFAAPGGKGAVLWIQDAGYIPADERIR
jgi:anti-sigma factor RsiW